MKLLTILLGLSIIAGFGHARPEFDKSVKIVGGEPAIQGELPHMLSLQLDGQHHCGASIIQVQGLVLAISAAHCTTALDDRYNVTVVAGDLKLSDTAGVEQRRRVTQIVNHDFDWMTKRNDICLLFIDEPFQFNENVRAIDLPDASYRASGSLLVSGWGLLSEGGSPSDNLMKVSVPIVDDNACNSSYAPDTPIFEDYLCAGVEGMDSCQQDSGGPAVSDDGALAGIVSFGIGCARENFPGVYTEVAYFIDWINEGVASYLLQTSK